MHDSRAFKGTPIGSGRDSETYYSNRYQYLLADSAYGISNRIISPFKKKKTRSTDLEGFEKLSPEYRRYNRNLSYLRVKIEHTIGILKLRFRSLQRLPIRIISTHDIKWVLQWIGTCVILHNTLLNNTWNYTEDKLLQILQGEQEREDDYDEDEAVREVQAVHEARRQARLPRLTQLEAEGHAKRLMLVRLINARDEEDERCELYELARRSNLLR